MDKIIALIEQIGGSKDLGKTIAEHLEKFKTDERAKIQDEYNLKLGKAKEVCHEEVEEYKKKLANKLQIFCESRVEKIESQIAKQVAIKDSAAEAKLQSIASLLEGIEVEANGSGNNADSKAVETKLVAVNEENKKLESQNRVLVEKAKRAHGIAETALERNEVLAKALIEARGSSDVPAKKVVSEGKAEKKAEEKPLSEGRKASDPATTRKTDESQVAKKVVTEAVAPTSKPNVFSPSGIAQEMDL